jgi:hypothetical protein
VLLSVEERKAELWRRGRLRWKLFSDQQEVYDFIRGVAEQVCVVNIARQFGKSFILCTIADEFARSEPKRLIRFVAPTQKMLRKIVVPIFRELHGDCPQHLRPNWNGVDGCWVYPNGSELHFAAANDGHADDSRGQRAHLCVVDEAGFVDDLDYLVTSVLLPQLLTTGGRIVLISTPPITPAHAFYGLSMRAKTRGAYIVRTIEDNKHISADAKVKLLEEMGGVESTQAQREGYCRFVVDASRAIVPEYTEKADTEIAALEPDPPTCEQPIVAMDVGFEDLHAVLFGYYDFRRAKLVVQDEVILRRARTDEIAAAVRAKEAALWGGKSLREPVRWSDTDLRLIADLSELHRLPFSPTQKDDKEAQVNALRMRVKNRGIHIAPRCEALRSHLMLGVWNKQRSEFDRSKEHGHFDAVDALIYMLRNADIYEDPYPALASHVTSYTHHIPGQLRNRQSDTAEAFAAAFGRSRRN